MANLCWDETYEKTNDMFASLARPSGRALGALASEQEKAKKARGCRRKRATANKGTNLEVQYHLHRAGFATMARANRERRAGEPAGGKHERRAAMMGAQEERGACRRKSGRRRARRRKLVVVTVVLILLLLCV